MLKPINYNSQSSVHFRAVHKITKSSKVKAELQYSLVKNLLSIKSALKDILAKNASSKLKPEVTAILNKFNMSFDKGIRLLSILGVGSAVKFFIPDKNEEMLGLEVKTGTEDDGIYYIEGSRVLKQVGKKQKYLTKADMETSNVEKMLEQISEATDLPLLRLRQAQNPPVIPYFPQYPIEEKETPNIEKKLILQDIEKAASGPQVIKVLPEEKNAETKITTSVLRDASEEVDKLIMKLRSDAIFTPSALSMEANASRGIGKISQRSKTLMAEILDLFSQLDSIYEEKGNIIFKKLKENLPTYGTYRKGASITFKDLGSDSSGLTFVRSHSKKHDAGEVYAIYKRNSKGEVVDIIPICNGKIYRMIKSFSLEDTFKFINMVSTSKCLSQKEVDSKNIPALLLNIKNELQKTVDMVNPAPGEISSEVKDLMAEIDAKRIELEEKQKNIRVSAESTYQNLKTGGIFIRNYNKLGDNLIYIDSQENKKMPGATLIRINERNGDFKEGWLLKDGKVLRNYNGKRNYFPKEIHYYNPSELEKMQFEEKVVSCLEEIRASLNMADKILNSYKNFKIR